MIKICPICQSSFITDKRKRIYCSHKCFAETQKTIFERTCKTCGKTFKPRGNAAAGKYCSRKCSGTERNGKVIQTCTICGKQKEVFASKGCRKFCSMKCAYIGRNIAKTEAGRKRLSDSKLGANNPNWKGGYRFHYGYNWRMQSKLARKRDVVCQSCGEPKQLHPLHVHHIIPFKSFDSFLEANQLDNLITLCPKCHKLVEWGKIPCPRSR